MSPIVAAWIKQKKLSTKWTSVILREAFSFLGTLFLPFNACQDIDAASQYARSTTLLGLAQCEPSLERVSQTMSHALFACDVTHDHLQQSTFREVCKGN